MYLMYFMSVSKTLEVCHFNMANPDKRCNFFVAVRDFHLYRNLWSPEASEC